MNFTATPSEQRAIETAAQLTGTDKPAQKIADLLRTELGVRVSGSRVHAFLLANEHDLKIWSHAVWHRRDLTRATHQHGEGRTR